MQEAHDEWTLDSFDFDGSPGLVEMPEGSFWTGLPALTQSRPEALIVGVFPAISQMERSFSAALRRLRLPAICMPPERAPLVRSLARELPVGIIVALWRDRQTIEPLRTQLPGVFVQYVLAPGEESRPLPNTGFECHRIPGVPEKTQTT